MKRERTTAAIYQDTLDDLQEIALKRKRKTGKKILLRDLMDEYLQKQIKRELKAANDHASQ